MIAADYPFLDVLWSMCIFFAFVIWIWLLITVFADVFRRHDIGGGMKAIWIVFLIIAPFLSALIYVVARGRGMAERHQAAMGGGRDTDTYVPPPIMSIPNPADQIASAQKLLDQGAINQAEFDQLKQKALA